MSKSGYFSNKSGNDKTLPTYSGNQFQVNSSSSMYAVARVPVVYSQSDVRHHMTESEPLSEYSEGPMTFMRTLPTPFRQQAHQQPELIRITEMSPHRSVSVPQGERDTASVRSLPPPQLMVQQAPYPSMQVSPSPQCFIPQYNPNPVFLMQSTSPQPPAAKAATLTTSSLPRITNVRSLPKALKLNSVTRKRFFIASVEQLSRWHKMAKKAQMYAIYEVSGILDSVRTKPCGVYHLILRSEKSSSPPLQAVYYPIDRELPKVKVGDLVTCVGQMVGTNKLQVFNIWTINPDALRGLNRIAFLCQRTLQETELANPEP